MTKFTTPNSALIGVVGVSTGPTGGAVRIVISALDVTSPLVCVDKDDSVVSGFAARPANARGLDSQAVTERASTTSSSVAVVMLGSTLLDPTAGEDAVLAVTPADLDDSPPVVDLLRGVVSSPLVSSVLTTTPGGADRVTRRVVEASDTELVSSVLTTTPGGADLVARRVVEAASDADPAWVLLRVDESEEVCVDSAARLGFDAPEAADALRRGDPLEVDADDVDDEAAEPDSAERGSAEATPYPVRMAVPTPIATASPPTRPMYRAAPIASSWKADPTAANLSLVKPSATGHSSFVSTLLELSKRVDGIQLPLL